MKTELFIHFGAEATWPCPSACWKGKSPVHHQLVGTVIRAISLKWQVPLERSRNAVLCVKLMAAATVKSPLVPRQTGTIISPWGKWNPWLGVRVLSANPHLPFMELWLCHLLLPSCLWPSAAVRGAVYIPQGWSLSSSPWFGWSSCPVTDHSDLQFTTHGADVAAVTGSGTRDPLFPSQEDWKVKSIVKDRI